MKIFPSNNDSGQKIDLEKFAKAKWYVQGFNATPNLIAHGHITALKGMWKTLGYGYTMMMNSYKNDYCEYYYSWKDLETIANIIFDKLHNNKDYLKRLELNVQTLTKKHFAKVRKARKIDLKACSISELIKHYQEQFFWYCEPCNITHLLEAFIVVDERLKIKLKTYYENIANSKDERGRKTFNEYFTILNLPIRPSFVNEEYLDLVKILQKVVGSEKLLKEINTGEIESKKLKNMLQEHQEKYFWVRSNYAHGIPLLVEDFVKEIQGLIEKGIIPEKELKDGNSYKKNREEKKRAIQELGINDKEILLMIEASELILHLQDDRKKQMLTAVTTFTPILYEIAERYNLDKRLIIYLLPKEVQESVLEKMNNTILRERKEGCVFFWETMEKNDGSHDYVMKLLTGDDYKQFILKMSKKEEKEEEKIQDLHGTCASPGTAIGKVKICRTKEDIEHFQKGEVLVSSMTRPEFVPAMKKAVAVITDEGGITCHAAIVSRELQVPCVIGTKISTRILHDGDEVEVKASHGLVRIRR